jgi:hypothetical protein
MFRLATVIFIALSMGSAAFGESWVDVGADTEAKYYVDLDSIVVDNENVNVTKKGIYTRMMTESFENDEPVVFKITEALVEIDCARELNRVTKIDMVNDVGDVVWTSGYMDRRLWLSIKSQGHSRTTFDLVCAQVQ